MEKQLKIVGKKEEGLLQAKSLSHFFSPLFFFIIKKLFLQKSGYEEKRGYIPS